MAILGDILTLLDRSKTIIIPIPVLLNRRRNKAGEPPEVGEKNHISKIHAYLSRKSGRRRQEQEEENSDFPRSVSLIDSSES